MTDNVRRLMARPAPPPAPVRLTCKRPTCSEPVDRSKGRPSLFCSDVCQVEYQRERGEVRRHLKDVHRLAGQYELEPDGSSSVAPRRTKSATAAPAAADPADATSAESGTGHEPEESSSATEQSAVSDLARAVTSRSRERSDTQLLRDLLHAVHLATATIEAAEPGQLVLEATGRLAALQRAIYLELAARPGGQQ